MDDLFKFSGDNIENVEKINLDELYEKKKEQDKNKLFTYNKILARIHEKIKLTSRQKCHQQFCWFVVPEIILGVANYDHAGCIAYLVDKLQENKFMVRYTIMCLRLQAGVPVLLRRLRPHPLPRPLPRRRHCIL